MFFRFLPLFLSLSAVAQTNLVVPQIKAEEVKHSGWKFGVDLGATASWSVDDKFVGVADGHYFAAGAKITGTATGVFGPHHWRNTLSVLETFSRTPALDAFLKSADALCLESIYMWYAGDWWGVFGQLNLDTAIFASDDIRAQPVTYVISNVTETATVSQTGTSLRLTGMFTPIALRQSAGLFATPFKSDVLTWDVKAGGMARETFARDQLVVSSATATQVNVATLSDFYQIGPSLGTGIFGEFMEKKLTYKAGVDLMYVAYRSSQKPLVDTFGNRLNVEATAAIGFRVVEWAGITWDFKALRLPDIKPEFQIQSNMLLTLHYVI